MKRNKVTSIASSTCNPWNPTVSTFLKWVTSFWFPVKDLSNLMKSKVILLEWTKVNGTFVGLRPERSRPIRRSRQEWILTDLICKQRDRQMITPGLWSLSLIHSAADSQRLITAGDREIASLAVRNCCISVRLNFKCETADLSPILPLYCGSHWVLCKIIEVTRTENWVFLRELPALRGFLNSPIAILSFYCINHLHQTRQGSKGQFNEWCWLEHLHGHVDDPVVDLEVQVGLLLLLGPTLAGEVFVERLIVTDLALR